VKITIHQSLCGEANKAWSLLKTTLNDTALAEKISFHTGIHDQVGGISWLPTVRGFAVEDFFLVMKTYPDKSPDVRPKRVFSHVLMIPREQISLIHDIATLFSFFPNEMDKNLSIQSIELDTNSNSELNFSTDFQGRFNKVIHGYRKLNEFKETIIWVGEEDFHQAISKFWKILTPSEKSNLNFGIYFNIEPIPKHGLNFITTPITIENKFINQGYFAVRKSDKHVLTDIIEQFIAEDEIAGKRITKFQEAIEAKKITRNDLDRIIIGIKPFEEFETITDLKKLVSLSHIVAEFSADEKKGIKFKEKLLDKICSLVEISDVTEFSIVKRFAIKSFIDSELKLSAAINKWADENIFSIEATKKKSYSAVFSQVSQTAPSNWWSKLLTERINSFLKRITTDSTDIIYNWIYIDFNIFSIIQAKIEDSRTSENHFALQLPTKFDKTHFKELKSFASKRNWVVLHATYLISEQPFETAMAEQLLIDKAPNSLDGISVIIKNAKPESILDFTIKNGDKRLIDISGQLCKNEPTLLAKIDFTNENWKTVWLSSILKGNEIGVGFKEPQKKIFKLYDSILEGNLLDETVWSKLSDSIFANIIDYGSMNKFWGKIPSQYQKKFLEKTSAKLLDSLHKNSTTAIPTDKTLSDYIINFAIGDFLFFNPIKNTLPIFNRFAKVPEHYIATYIRNYQGQISAIEATQLGKLIRDRNYTDVANEVYNKSTKHNNWKFGLAESHHILNFYLKAALVFSGILNSVNIPTDQWWESAEDIIIDLYPNPISLVTVWKKSGGEEADLLMQSSTRNVWSNAIHNLRANKFSDITMCSLLKQIKKNYGDNEKFKIIYELRKDYISC